MLPISHIMLWSHQLVNLWSVMESTRIGPISIFVLTPAHINPTLITSSLCEVAFAAAAAGISVWDSRPSPRRRPCDQVASPGLRIAAGRRWLPNRNSRPSRTPDPTRVRTIQNSSTPGLIVLGRGRKAGNFQQLFHFSRATGLSLKLRIERRDRKNCSA